MQQGGGRDLVCSLISYWPRERASAAAALAHPWFGLNPLTAVTGTVVSLGKAAGRVSGGVGGEVGGGGGGRGGEGSGWAGCARARSTPRPRLIPPPLPHARTPIHALCLTCPPPSPPPPHTHTGGRDC